MPKIKKTVLKIWEMLEKMKTDVDELFLIWLIKKSLILAIYRLKKSKISSLSKL